MSSARRAFAFLPGAGRVQPSTPWGTELATSPPSTPHTQPRCRCGEAADTEFNSKHDDADTVAFPAPARQDVLTRMILKLRSHSR